MKFLNLTACLLSLALLTAVTFQVNAKGSKGQAIERSLDDDENDDEGCSDVVKVRSYGGSRRHYNSRYRRG